MQVHHGISDPGEEIVEKAIKENVKIVPIPGACAMINALISSRAFHKRIFILRLFICKCQGEKRETRRKQIRNKNSYVIRSTT